MDLKEKRLIDAEKCYCIAKAYHSDFEQNLANLHSLRELLDDCPIVDAVEVVHGKWEDMWDGKYANPRYRCSVCKEKANYKSVQDELLSWRDVQVLTPYCPYCLAKLDGGIGNDIKAV